ncbi:hypothetical protein [Streptomyces sp. NPDC003247]|uniref:LppU/SCO3897 family protein n=1 Tax=Streptomyces sp. NPDC003247 TaxID=3364677 RepID=UPI0036C221D3
MLFAVQAVVPPLLGLLVTAVPVLMVIGLASGGSAPEHLTVGSCVRNDASWPDQNLANEPCGSPDAQFRVLEPGTEGCEDGDYLAYPENSENGITSLCLRPLD